MNFLGVVAFYVLLLLIWFKTDAFAEYSRLLKLKWTNVDGYYLIKDLDPEFTFHKFLLEYFNCFFVRLITCPICIGTILSLLTSPLLVLCFGWWAPPLLECLGLFFFFLLAMLVNKYV